MSWLVLFLPLIFIMLFWYRFTNNQKKILIIIVFVTLALMSGTRDYISYGATDEAIYKAVFNAVPSLDQFNMSNIYDVHMKGFVEYEIGYLFVNSLVKTLGFSYHGFFIFHSLFFYYCLYKFFKYFKCDFFIFIFMFIYQLMMYNTYVSLRQSITIGIFFLSVQFIMDKKLLSYIMCCFIALLFHNAAIVMPFFYLVNMFELTKNRYIYIQIIFLSTLVLRFTNVSFVKSFLDVLEGFFLFEDKNISGYYSESSLSFLHTIQYYCVSLIPLFFFDKYKNDKRWVYAIKFLLILAPIFTLFSTLSIITRIKDYLIMFYPIIISFGCYAIKRNQAIVIKLLVIILSISGFYKYTIDFDKGLFKEYRNYIIESTDR